VPATFTPDTETGAGKFASGARMVSTGNFAAGIYPTGGVSVTPGLFGLSTQILDLYLDFATGGYIYAFDRANSKVKAFANQGSAGPMIEVANGVDLTNNVARCRAEAKG
jgi:hypothetical protein